MNRLSLGIDSPQPVFPALDFDLGCLGIDPEFLPGPGDGVDAPANDGAPTPRQPLSASPAGAGPTAHSELFAGLVRFEGNVRHMYRDTEGHVTTGVGHLLRTPADAQKLPWIDGRTGQRATPEQIDAEFDRVIGMPEGLKAGGYREPDGLVLPKALAAALSQQRLENEFLPGLRRIFPDFDAFPREAQRALVDMVYNLGVAGLGKKFPKMIAACNSGDWATAAEQCRRSSCREDRNAWTRDQFLAITTGVTAQKVTP
jgi:GH24 family phage-related lysozyme (muramidase)